MSTARTFRFRPRFRGIALGALGLGGGVAVLAVVASAGLPLVALGAVGALLGGTYLGSPTWRLAVTLDDEALSVGSPGRVRFRLPWDEVLKVIVAESKHTCFVDGGAPERSLLVPGDGAPAPYDIEHRSALVAEILQRVAPEIIDRVESLEGALGTPRPS